MTVESILQQLQQLGDDKTRQSMSRFGINAETAFGIKIPVLRQLAKTIGKDHNLAQELWKTGIHEARLLAIFIADARQVDEALMEQWVRDLNSWDICDQCCGGLFNRTPFAFEKACQWTKRKEEFVKRAGFSMMASLALRRKKADDREYLAFFLAIEKEAHDERNFVKKAVSWALRQIGKRNTFLKGRAIETAQRIAQQNSKSARWIAADVLRELTGH